MSNLLGLSLISMVKLVNNSLRAVSQFDMSSHCGLPKKWLGRIKSFKSCSSTKNFSFDSFFGVFEGFRLFYCYNLDVSIFGDRLSRRLSTSIFSIPRSIGTQKPRLFLIPIGLSSCSPNGLSSLCKSCSWNVSDWPSSSLNFCMGLLFPVRTWF